MTFEETIAVRSAEVYADFFSPHLQPFYNILDCGCGTGSITLGLAKFVPNGTVVGIDLNSQAFRAARDYLDEQEIGNVEFCAASMMSMPYAPHSFSACLCHSALETLDDPVGALKEIRRVMKPGGVIGVASVEYDGLLLSGPGKAVLHKFYAVREQLWQLEAIADPYRGKHLRRLLHTAGFINVKAEAKYFSYGDKETVFEFGKGRASDCDDAWYVEGALKHNLLTKDELTKIKSAWEEWAISDEAFAAFAWCRTTAINPTTLYKDKQ